MSRSTSTSASTWQQLPPEILVKIFQQLGDKERCCCAMTCHHWQETMAMPELWRKRTFTFKKSQRRAATFLSTYGRHLTDLKLEFLHWKTVSDHRISLLKKLLKQIPPGLKNFAVIFSFEIQFLSKWRRKKSELVALLCDMLKLQKNLERVDFSQCDLGDRDGCQLLQALKSVQHTPASQTSLPGTLRDLAINGLVSQGVTSSFVKTMGNFTTLQRLSLSPHDLRDIELEMLMAANPQLKDLHLVICGSYEFRLFLKFIGRDTLASIFQEAVRKSTELRVSLDICDDNHGDSRRFVVDDLQEVLVPTLPLVSFEFNYPRRQRESLVEEIADHLLYVAGHFRNLTILYVQSGDRAETWNRPDALVQLVMDCPSLSRLSIMKKIPFETVLQVATAHSAESLHFTVAACDNLDLEKLSGTRCFVSVN